MCVCKPPPPPPFEITQIMKLTISVDFPQYHVIKTQTDTHKKKVSESNNTKTVAFCPLFHSISRVLIIFEDWNALQVRNLEERHANLVFDLVRNLTFVNYPIDQRLVVHLNNECVFPPNLWW